MLTYTQTQIKGYDIYKLKYEASEKEWIEVWINTSHGMNMCQLVVNGSQVIHWDQKRCDALQSYGTPILYPAPNRVGDNCFTFEGKTYPMMMHGVLRFQACDRVEIYKTKDEISLTGYFVFREGSRLHDVFPFKSTLAITYTVSDGKVKMAYTLKNQDDKNLPYGLGLHPFFNKIGKTSMAVCAEQIMEMSEEKLPTGILKDIKGTNYDLNILTEVDGIGLDHVYTDRKKQPQARVVYDELNFEIKLLGSEQFNHIVVFTPQGQPFFCIENQTCSTNAHNLYNKGYKEVSGLQIVKPHESVSGEVNYCIVLKDKLK